MDALLTVPEPRNEPVRSYAPGSPERASLQARLIAMAGERLDLTMTIDGRQSLGGGGPIEVVQPHKRHHVLGVTGRERRHLDRPEQLAMEPVVRWVADLEVNVRDATLDTEGEELVERVAVHRDEVSLDRDHQVRALRRACFRWRCLCGGSRAALPPSLRRP